MSERASRRRRVLLSAVTAVALLAPPPTAPPAEAAIGPSFVTRVGDRLMLDGHDYRFSGANIYSANSDGWCGPPYSDAELEEAFDEIGGGGPAVVRSWFFQPLAASKDPGTTQMWSGTRDWTRFDRMLDLAAQNDIRIIATLTDNWGECGDGGASGQKPGSWYVTGYDQPLPTLQTRYDHVVSYRDWVTEVVSRYRDNPAIVMWQLVNEAEVNLDEPQGCQGGIGNGNALRAFAEDMSNHVRAIDPNHLISLGTLGGGQCGTEFTNFELIHDVPNIDVCEYHDYDQTSTMPGDQWNGLAFRFEQCRNLGKPLFIGEAGLIPNQVGGTYEDRAAMYRAKILRQSAEGLVGYLAWAYMRTGSQLTIFDIGPGDPALNVLAEAPAFVVNTTDDLDDTACTRDHCSLREAITDANMNPGVDTIAFSIEPFSGAAPVIQPTSELPDFIDGAIVDGTSQPFHGIVQLDGANAPSANGLVLRGGSRVQGMSVTGFAEFGRAGIVATGTGNEIVDNVIGLDPARSAAAPNWLGVFLLGPENHVGAPGHGNVIAGNGNHGIQVGRAEQPDLDTHGNVIQGNVIGYNPGLDGTQVLAAPNAFAGIELNTTTQTLVGGSGPGEGNVISGNTGVGIIVSSPANVIQGNRLGTDATGTVAVPNVVGVSVSFGPDNVIGGGDPGEGNLISGNTYYGIQVDGTGPVNTRIVGNLIGTDAGGQSAIPNELAGVLLTGDGTLLGSADGERNVISGNGFAGVWLFSANGNAVRGNLIGVAADGASPLPNQLGVFVQDPATVNEIGSPNDGLRNTIAHNTGAGIALQGGAQTHIMGNSIFANGEVGIDIGHDGPTPNDPGDGDGGANHGQNFPEITAASTRDGSTTIRGTIDGSPGTPVLFLELFANVSCDPSGFGEGESPVGLLSVPADANGDITFSYELAAPLALGTFVTAIATRNAFEGSESSEFSACFEVNDAPLDDTASQTVPAGSVVSTDTEGDGATPSDPIETSVTPSSGGLVTLDESVNAAPPPAGYALAGTSVAITAPPGTAAAPIRIELRLDSSALPAGQTAATIQLLRNGVPVEDCSTADGTAAPDPCLSLRATAGDDILLVALTSQASLWQIATVTPYSVGGLYQPVDNRPSQNIVKAGQSVPVTFSLGGDRGLGVLATGSPTSARFPCGTATLDPLEQVATAGASGLTYDFSTGRYTLVWKTQKAWAGTCRQLSVTFDDGSTLQADFRFTK